MGQVITFYSYKGGTGRSMALANTACLLARSLPPGDAVLAIDWDLEAPGLHRFFPQAEGGNSKSGTEQLGVIDLVLELQALLQSKDSIRKDPDAVAEVVASIDFDRFIVPTQVPNVLLMRAGAFNDEYENRVVSFNWPSFYQSVPSALPALVDLLSTRYSYVLIDSRTGLSDITGVCTMMLPEKLVTVFTPSRQSLDGLEGIIRRALTYRRQAPDLRPLAVFPLPSRIELAEPDLREAWRLGDSEGFIGYQALFESLFRDLYELPACSLQNYFDDVQIQHVPRYAYGERIAVLVEKEADRLSLTRSYQAFVERLEHLSVPWDSIATSTIEGHATRPLSDEAERSYQQAADLYAEVGDIRGQSKVLAALSKYQLQRGAKEEADLTIDRAMSLVERMDVQSQAELFLELGDLVLPTDPARAMNLYSRASNLPAGLSIRADAFRKLGDSAFMLGHFSRSLEYYNIALSQHKLSPDGQRQIQPRLAKANLETGRYETAANLFATILQQALASGDARSAADAQLELALANLGRGDLDAAYKNVTEAAGLYDDVGVSKPDLWLAHARIAAERGDLDEANKLINQAIQEYRRINDKRGIATALRYAGDFRARKMQVKSS